MGVEGFCVLRMALWGNWDNRRTSKKNPWPADQHAFLPHTPRAAGRPYGGRPYSSTALHPPPTPPPPTTLSFPPASWPLGSAFIIPPPTNTPQPPPPGQLAAWLRLHYPSSVAGALAASAPVLAFDGLPRPAAAAPAYSPFDGRRYWAVVSRDASAAAGADPRCAGQVRDAWPHLFALAKSAGGRSAVASAFRLCTPLDTGGEEALAALLLNAWDTLAMGNFPYASNYLIYQQTEDPAVLLPPWPMRAACAAFVAAAEPTPPGEPAGPPSGTPSAGSPSGTPSAGPPSGTPSAGPPFGTPAVGPPSGSSAAAPLPGTPAASPRALALLRGMAAAVGVLYNASGHATCLELPADLEFDGLWDWQFCSERLPQETYFELDANTTMFWVRTGGIRGCERDCGGWGLGGGEAWCACGGGRSAGMKGGGTGEHCRPCRAGWGRSRPPLLPSQRAFKRRVSPVTF